METATEDQSLHSPSIPCPTDQSTFQHNSLKERGSDVEEESFQEKGKTFPSQLRDSCTQRREPKTDEENTKETELKGRNNCIAPSESEGCSHQESSRKRKMGSVDSARNTTRASLNERNMILGKNKPKVPDAGHSSEREKTQDACSRRPRRRNTGRSKRPRS
ncbi:hypothetical protein HPG69_013973, partial [Diceros bicornis minor]